VKFSSTIHVDIERIVSLRYLLYNYPRETLERFCDLIEMEIQGLGGDLKPKNIIAASLIGAIVIGLGLVAAWSKIWANFWGNVFDIAKDTLLKGLADHGWIRTIAAAIFVFGGFVGIVWYTSASRGNLKQIRRLRSIQRAIKLYLLFEEEPADAES